MQQWGTSEPTYYNGTLCKLPRSSISMWIISVGCNLTILFLKTKCVYILGGHPIIIESHWQHGFPWLSPHLLQSSITPRRSSKLHTHNYYCNKCTSLFNKAFIRWWTLDQVWFWGQSIINSGCFSSTSQALFVLQCSVKVPDPWDPCESAWSMWFQLIFEPFNIFPFSFFLRVTNWI